MKSFLRMGAALLALAAAGAANAQVFVGAGGSTPTAIGPVVAGQTYTVTATGTSDLYAAFNNNQGVTFDANGIPTYQFPSPYTAFYPNGLDYDPSQNTSAHGIAGAGFLYGALLGTFTATPGAGDYFMLGTSDTFTASASGTLYGVVNDCANCYGDNDAQSGFTVTLATVAGVPVRGVPEPKTWALMLLGFGLVGVALRRGPRPLTT